MFLIGAIKPIVEKKLKTCFIFYATVQGSWVLFLYAVCWQQKVTQKKGENKVLTHLPEEERKILILKIVLNVSHLMIHRHKILLIHSSTLFDSKWNIRIITNIGPKSLFQNIVAEMHHFYNFTILQIQKQLYFFLYHIPNCFYNRLEVSSLFLCVGCVERERD